MTEKICKEIIERLEREHIRAINGADKPILLISAQYPGIWLEHVYDSVFYAGYDRSKLYLAENVTELFMSLAKPDGQLPFVVKDKTSSINAEASAVGYSQIQECVSFAKMCVLVYKMNQNKDYLRRAYDTAEAWVGWLKRNRMTTGRGLVEMFVGFDTGHDNSGRLRGMSYPKNQIIDGERQGAEVIPSCAVAPIIAVDMNCNYYSTLTSLSYMASELSMPERAESWKEEARGVKKRLFDLCYDEDDCFFYDVDKNRNKRRYLSSTVFHLFMEGVLDKSEDAEMIKEIYERHISNPKEFATPYPYPSMAICDPSCKDHVKSNCWGYYSQGLIALRATLWMDEYGFGKDLDRLCRSWLSAWENCYGRFKLGQELDPISGEPTDSSEWYSSTMLFFLYAAMRIKGCKII